METNKIMQADVDDIVFEHRNKSYGAYLLRRLYSKNLTKAVLGGVLFYLLLVSVPFIYGVISELNFVKKEKKVVEVVLEAPPPLDPNEPPPPPPPPPPPEPPPPVQPQVKYVPPVIKKDVEVKEEEAPPPPDELKDVEISTKNVEGDKTAKSTIDTSGPAKVAPPPPPPVVEEVKPPPPPPDEVFQIVEQMPSFPDGDAALMKYLSTNIKYPAMARENSIEGTVYIAFVVNKEGGIEDAKVARKLGGGCDEEALRVVKGMPKWNPGKQSGKPVKVKYTVPVKFKLE